MIRRAFTIASLLRMLHGCCYAIHQTTSLARKAYTLAPGGSGGRGTSGGDGRSSSELSSKDFGREAINEIMGCMNDGDPVIIFAGYATDMERFVRANAGLFRRIDVRYVCSFVRLYVLSNDER